MTPRRAAVYFGDRRAGVLSKVEKGFRFEYDRDYLSTPDAVPISLGLPLRLEPYEARELFPFFAGLLPEGWLLRLTSQVARIDPSDAFGLLLHTGADPVGAVSVRPDDA